VAQHKSLKKKLGKKHIEPIDDGLLKQRAVKSPDEIKAIRAALAIQQQAFVDLRDVLKPGETERQIAASLEFLMRSAGADGPSFPTIVAADANASLPHAVPGDRKLKAGGSVLIDFGARAHGYCSDLTRVVGLGSMPAKIKEIYKVVLEAQLAAIAAIKPGAKLRDIDAAARDVIVKAGYGPQFGHSTGHGIGLDIHEQPTLAARSEGSLEPGHVVTVEPGIYLPGVGGVRIEDDVLVTDKGHTVLSDLPKSLESAII
jgi:Xaa-Pro aminopeptidase